MDELREFLAPYLTFDTIEEAESILGSIKSFMDCYGYVTPTDLLAMVGEEECPDEFGKYLSHRFSDAEAHDFRIRYAEGRYYISIPDIREPSILRIQVKSCCLTCADAYWTAAPYFSEPRYLPNPRIRSCDILCKHNRVCAKYQACTTVLQLMPKEVKDE